MRRQPVLLSDEEYGFLTDDEKVRYHNDLKIERALGSPLDYMLAVNKKAKPYPHVKIISDIIVAAVEHRLYKDGPGPDSVTDSEGVYRHPVTGEPALDRVKVALPPRHSKSYTISQHTPSWFLSNYPDLNVILATMGEDFSAKWGSANRDNITSNPQFGIELRPDMTSKVNWKIKGHDGGMKSVGIGGQITGEGAHLFIIDDYLKNWKEAQSKTIRDDQWEWYGSTVETRTEPGCVIVILATRWHEDDLQGRLDETEPELWFTLNIPALAYEDADEEGFSIDPDTGKRDPLGRKPNEALCPDRYQRPYFERKRKTLGNLMFTAMYQCKPSVAEGNKFKNFKNRYTLIDGIYTLKSEDGSVVTFREDQCYRISTVDLAATDKTTSDWNVFATGDITPDHRLILRNVVREKMESWQHTKWFTTNYAKMRPRYSGVENKTYGLTLIQNIRRLGRYIVKSIDTPGDKEAKAQPATEAVNGGLVYLPEDAEWVEPWITEHKKFPNASHDDQVDTTSMLVDEFNLIAPWATEKVIEDRSIEARMERYMDERESSQHEHPELGWWY